MHLFGGGDGGVRRWRLADGEEAPGKQAGIWVYSISVSMDQKWVVHGTDKGASVWDAELHEKLVDVECENSVWTVDVSPDSTKFAIGTGSGDNKASIWDIITGKRLVGPLQHDNYVTGVRFSPDGEHIATSCWGSSVRIFDSRNGDEVIAITTTSPSEWPITPLAWSNDCQQIFTISDDNKIKLFTVSTGSQITESPILVDGHISIALAPNGKFIVAYAGPSILFLDASTLAHIVPAIEVGGDIYSITISPDGSYLACGQGNGKINVRGLGSILPDSYGPFQVSICPLTMSSCRVCPIPSSPLTY